MVGKQIKTHKIYGMTCSGCERTIETLIKSEFEVISIQASFKNNTISIKYKNQPATNDALNKILERGGYSLKSDFNTNNHFNNPIYVLVGIVMLYILLNRLGALDVFNYFPEAQVGMGYFAIFVVGLFTSLHCIGMCGGICLSQCAKPTSISIQTKRALNPSVVYNLGRVISYTIIGGFVGALGSVITPSGVFKGVVGLLAGFFMITIGINMLSSASIFKKIQIRMPRVLTRKIYESSSSPLYVGMLNGFMPCGPLQAMQLYALSTGSPIQGALSMFFFSLGTMPLMVGLGAISSIMTQKFKRQMLTVSGVLIIVLGISMFQMGLALSDLNVSLIPSGSRTESMVNFEDNVQKVYTNVYPRKYESIQVVKDVPVEWYITAESSNLNGCNNELVIPFLGIRKKLYEGTNVISFIPTETGTFSYSCWMGMIRSSITIE